MLSEKAQSDPDYNFLINKKEILILKGTFKSSFFSSVKIHLLNTSLSIHLILSTYTFYDIHLKFFIFLWEKQYINYINLNENGVLMEEFPHNLACTPDLHPFGTSSLVF